MKFGLSSLSAAFSGASRSRQFLVTGAILAIVLLSIGAAYLVLRPSYHVLFSDLKPQDASAIIETLDKEKIPYRIDEQRNAVLVQEGDTRATRLKLMNGDLRLHGVVGFELMNKSDLGLTEFTQKVTYQRALQGELARTIMSLDEIAYARVHLSLPESALFRRDAVRPRASVALFTRDGFGLDAKAVRGIQKLVAAAVPELSTGDVTVVDQRGELLVRRDDDVDDPNFALKQAIEASYERKVRSQIAALAGPGQVAVSVEADVNFDQVRKTLETDVRQPTQPPQAKPGAGPLPVLNGKGASALSGPLPLLDLSASRETKTERRVEQVVAAPGAIRRLSVGVVLEQAQSAETLSRMNAMIAASIGLSRARGDELSILVQAHQPADGVHALKRSDGDKALPKGTTPTALQSDQQIDKGSDALVKKWSRILVQIKRVWGKYAELLLLLVALGVIGVLGLIGWVVVARRGYSSVARRRLNEQERADYVKRLRSLLAQEGGAV